MFCRTKLSFASLRVVAVVLAVSVAFIGCDATGPDASDVVDESSRTEVPMRADTPFHRLLTDVGGHDALATLLKTASDTTLRRTFARHDIAYVVHDVRAVQPGDPTTKFTSADGVTDCPRTFNTSVRNAWHAVRGSGGYEAHYIDGSGRPYVAYKTLSPTSGASRDGDCQADVGNLTSNADGGHLIGTQLGGWGRRANLAPQNSNFNRGNWLQLENQLDACEPVSGAYAYVYATYTSSSLVPTYWDLRATVSGATRWAYFDNADSGGPNGTQKRRDMTAWLEQQGCS